MVDTKIGLHWSDGGGSFYKKYALIRKASTSTDMM